MKWPLTLLGLVIAFSLCLVLYLFIQIPSEKTLRGCFVTEMYKVDFCPSSKNYVPLSRISKYMQKSVLLTEDSSFYQHDGFDWEAIEKSAKENLKKGKFKRGGSTITQQLAKNLFLSKDKTLIRKFLEMLITMKIEKVLSKKEILEKYLNVIEFGPNIFGIKAAAQFYFKKPASDLSIVESAFLAMLLPNPKKYSHSFFKGALTPFARKRIQKIITDLAQYNRITPEEHESAIQQFANFLSKSAPEDEFTLDTPNEDSSEEENEEASQE